HQDWLVTLLALDNAVPDRGGPRNFLPGQVGGRRMYDVAQLGVAGVRQVHRFRSRFFRPLGDDSQSEPNQGSELEFREEHRLQYSFFSLSLLPRREQVIDDA